MIPNQALTDLLEAPARQLSLSGEITLLTGTRLPFDGRQVLSFSLSEGCSDGHLLGGAFSAACTLALHNAEGYFTGGYSLMGAQVCVWLCAGEEQSPLAVFTVSQVSNQWAAGRLVLSGADALGTAFEAAFEDDFSYPISLGALAQGIAGRAGFALDVDFPNAGIYLNTAPLWGEITLRQALGYIAGAAGCFAMVDRGGQLQFRRVWPEETVRSVTADQILTHQGGEIAFGPLQGLRIHLTGAPQDTEPLIVSREGATLSDFNCLSVSGNPLLSQSGDHVAALARGMLLALSGMSLTPSRLSWRGDPRLMLGDRARLLLPGGGWEDIPITRQSLAFSQGFSMQSDCTAQPYAPTVGRLFTAGGALNAAVFPAGWMGP